MGGGCRNTVSLNELISWLERVLGHVDVEYKEVRPHDQKYYVSDISKAIRVLNWTPNISPFGGVKLMINWYQKFMKQHDFYKC
jgi:CDP-paratose 2-epimerase